MWPALTARRKLEFVLCFLITAACFPTLTASGADTLVIGNNSDLPNLFGGGPIETFDFDAGGTQVGAFTPDGALPSSQTRLGRGLVVIGEEFFYTELSITNVYDPDSDTYQAFLRTEAIRVGPFNGGAGGADTRTIPNPSPLEGIASLAYADGVLYVLTGYTFEGVTPVSPLRVWKLNPSTGAVLATPTTLFGASGSHRNNSADGFTVLPNGNFLINTGDTDLQYDEINRITGMPTGFSFNVPTATNSTGVDTDGTHLFFAANINMVTARIIETDLSGNFIAEAPQLGGTHLFEDISVPHPFIALPRPTAAVLTATWIATNRSFQLGFTNFQNLPFTVVHATNPLVPLSNWISLGTATEFTAGHYVFSDSGAATNRQRFYRVVSP
jgi:hypothetical protein